MPQIVAYVVVKVKIDVDMSKTDQSIKDHEDEIRDYVSQELDYEMTFDGMVEAGDDSDNAIEVPAKIVGTEIMGVLEDDPT